MDSVMGINIVPETVTNKQYYIFVGQSNARGNIAHASATSNLDNLYPNSDMKFWNGTSNAWVDMDFVSGSNEFPQIQDKFGFEMELGRSLELFYAGSQPLYFFKYAIGGSSLAAQGGEDDWNDASTGELVDDAIAEEAVLQAATTNLGSPVLIWVQGERDSKIEAEADAYAVNLAATLDLLEAAWSPQHTIIMQTSTTILPAGTYPFRATVKAAQGTVAAARSNTTAVDTDSYGGGSAHYDQTGYASGALDIFNIVKTL